MFELFDEDPNLPEVATRFSRIEYQRPRRCLLTFEKQDGCLLAEPMRPFKPRGLVIWGAEPGAMLEQAFVGSDMQGRCSMPPIPVRWFESGANYEQIRERMVDGEDMPEWVDWDTCTPGGRLRLGIKPFLGSELAVMWGYCI